MQNYQANDSYMNPNQSCQEIEPIGTYTAKTFLWMFFGLMLTFAVSVGGYATGLISYVFYIPYFPFVLLALELVVVFVLAARIQKMSVMTARVLFFVYALINGVVFSTYFLIYDVMSLVVVFGATALYFGAMAVYGYVTKANLSNLKPILFGGLIFLIIFWVLSMFLPMAGFERIVCLIGIAVFMGFTAYDTQKIKSYHAIYANDPEMASKASIYSALQLYLDFVNLFLYLLRFIGARKN